MSAKAKDVDAAKAFVKWLWIDQTKLQEDWSHLLRLPHPAAQEPRGEGHQAAERHRRRGGEALRDQRALRRPVLDPRRMTTVSQDMVNNAVVKEGADPSRRGGQGRARVEAELEEDRLKAADRRHDSADQRRRPPGATAPPGPAAKPRTAAPARDARQHPVASGSSSGPFLPGLLLFVYVPVGWSLYLSLFEAHNTVTPTKFVGLDNYARHADATRPFTDSLVDLHALRACSSSRSPTPCRWRWRCWSTASAVTQAFFRSVFFLPTACSYVVASLIWKLSIFNGVRFGLANTVLGWFGIDPIAWLGTVPPALVLAGAGHRTAVAAARAST